MKIARIAPVKPRLMMVLMLLVILCGVLLILFQLEAVKWQKDMELFM